MKQTHLNQSIFAAAGIILIAAFFVHKAVLFMRAEHTIYSWDSLGLWIPGAEMVTRPDYGIIGMIAAFGRSMHHNYNLFCALPASCMMALWGTSRFCYVISNVVFLIIPSAIVCLCLFVGLTASTWRQAGFVIFAFLALVSVPLPWIVTLGGMTDVGGLIMAAVATNLLIRTEVGSRNAIRWLAIGAAMALTALSKRWYLYLVVGLLAVLMVELIFNCIGNCLRSRSLTFSSLVALAYGPFFCFCGLTGVYLFSFPLPVEILTTNYSYVYSAYQTAASWPEGVVKNAVLISQNFGLIQVALAFLCFAASLFFAPTRRAALYLYVPGWLALANFSKVQTMNGHHMLLLYIATVIPPLFLARQLISSDFKNGKAWGWTILGAAVIISCLSFQSVFASRPPLGTSFVQDIFPTVRVQPVQRHDLGVIEALMRFIGSKVDNQPGQVPVKNVYLLSSSLLLNSSHLNTAGFQLNKDLPAVDNICQTYDVDLRDGFPDPLLTATLVLVADPIQTHLKGEQKVVTVPVRMFLNGEGFAQAFTRDPQVFQLDQGIRVYTFERVRPSTPEEIAQLRKEIGVPSNKNGGMSAYLKL